MIANGSSIPQVETAQTETDDEEFLAEQYADYWEEFAVDSADSSVPIDNRTCCQCGCRACDLAQGESLHTVGMDLFCNECVP